MLTEPHPGFDVAPLALIVDRDDDSRLLYSDFLELNQWRVITAAGGPEALAKAIAERPDVVVSETRLPGFDGVILSELLKRDCSTAHIPIVFVSSDATAANLERAAAAGAQAVLTKPCLPEALLTSIERVMQRSHELRLQGTATHWDHRPDEDCYSQPRALFRDDAGPAPSAVREHSAIHPCRVARNQGPPHRQLHKGRLGLRCRRRGGDRFPRQSLWPLTT